MKPAMGVGQRLLSLDLRALGAFRIGLASVILLDLGLRTRDFTAHYTERGVLPLAALSPHPFDWVALHKLSGSAGLQAGLFALHALCALALLIGLRTRLSTVLCWLLALSLQSRNPWLSSDGDTLLRQLLLLSACLPLGARFSLDALAHGAAPVAPITEVRSLPAFALMLQVTLVVATNGVLKSFSLDWTETGLAIYYAVHQCHTGVGTLMLLLPEAVFPLLTHAVHAMELLVPVALWLPVRSSTARHFSAALGMLLLFLLWIMLSVGILPLLTAVALIVFLPGPRFERLERAHGELLARLASLRWLPRLAAPARLVPGRGATLLCALVLIDVVGYNLESIPGRPLPAVVLLRPLAERAGLVQRWPMFSAPSHVTRWVAVVGTVDGRQRSLAHLADDLTPADSPRWRSHPPHGYRWLKLFESLLESGDAAAWQRVAHVLCDTWRAQERVKAGSTLSLYSEHQTIERDYAYGPIGAERLAHAECAAAK
jgi:hypothetical protein